jgi:hypothetical protein
MSRTRYHPDDQTDPRVRRRLQSVERAEHHFRMFPQSFQAIFRFRGLQDSQ